MKHPKTLRDDALEKRLKELSRKTLYSGRATTLEHREHRLLQAVKVKESWKFWACSRQEINTHEDMIRATAKHIHSKNPANISDDGLGDTNIWRLAQKEYESALALYDKELNRIQSWNSQGQTNVIKQLAIPSAL